MPAKPKKTAASPAQATSRAKQRVGYGEKAHADAIVAVLREHRAGLDGAEADLLSGKLCALDAHLLFVLDEVLEKLNAPLVQVDRKFACTHGLNVPGKFFCVFAGDGRASSIGYVEEKHAELLERALGQVVAPEGAAS